MSRVSFHNPSEVPEPVLDATPFSRPGLPQSVTGAAAVLAGSDESGFVLSFSVSVEERFEACRFLGAL